MQLIIYDRIRCSLSPSNPGLYINRAAGDVEGNHNQTQLSSPISSLSLLSILSLSTFLKMAAASPSNPKANYHIRSISLPSKPHPLFQQCEDYLLRIIASSDATSSSSSAISNKLSGLLDLHNCMNDLFQLPLTQEAFVRERNEKWVDELLDSSLRLLDVCTAAKDALIHTKECAREIQSTMRRRRGGQTGFTNEVKKYFASRKVVKKAICKALVTLKSCEKKSMPSFSSTNKDNVAVALVSVLREVEAVSLTVFESLLSFISGSKAQSKMRGWSFVSKLMLNKRVACDEEKSEVNEFADVDAALSCLVGQETSKSDNISCSENVQSDLQQLESCSQDLEEGLECLFRRLIKNRVSLLNTLSN